MKRRTEPNKQVYQLPSAPSWLSELVEFPIRRAEVRAGQSVVIHVNRGVEEAEGALTLEFASTPRGIVCLRLEKDSTGKMVRTIHPGFNRLKTRQRRLVGQFVLRARVVAGLEKSMEHEGLFQTNGQKSAWAMLKRLRELREGAGPEEERGRSEQRSIRESTVSDPNPDEVPSDLRLFFDLLTGKWGSVFSRSDDTRDGSWIDVLLSAIEGDVAQLQNLANGSGRPAETDPLAKIRGMVFGHTGFQDAAIQTYETIPPDQLDADVCLEVARYFAIGEISEQAVVWLRRALLAPDANETVPRRVCGELIRIGAFDEARVVLESLCEPAHSHQLGAGEFGELARMLTDLYLWAARVDEAKRMLERLEHVEGFGRDTFWMLRSRGILLALESRWTEALDVLLGAEQLNPGDSEVTGWLAELLVRKGDTSAASQCLDRSRAQSDEPYHILLGSAIDPRRESPVPEIQFYLERLGKVTDASLRSPKTRRNVLLDALTCFGGQRGQPATMLTSVSDGSLGLTLVGTPPKKDSIVARTASGALLKRIGTMPLPELEERFGDLARTYPDSPHPWCYKGEFLLWLGRFDEALNAFDEALSRRVARWAFVGRAAVHLLRGEHRLANAALRKCASLFAPIPGATTHVYQGEAARLQGRWSEAMEHLRIAVEAKPGRIGAWINLALVLWATGQGEEAERIVTSLERRFPRLFWDSGRALTGKASWPVPRDLLPDVLEKSLELMRGNRSSHRMTYFDSDGKFRLFHTEIDWNAQVRRRSHFVIADLVGRIVRGEEA